MKTFFINGRFLTQHITGVQRYAMEIVKELDTMVHPGEMYIVVPLKTEHIPSLKNISIIRVGKSQGHLWEQIVFPIYVLKKGGIPISFCSSSPLLYPGIAYIHDARLKRTPNSFSKMYFIWYSIVFHNATKRAKKVITVSNFSKKEICELYHITPDRVEVIPCAWQHYDNVPFDENALKKYGLEKKQYYFSLSSLEPNKNLKWIAEVAKNNPEFRFAVAGSISNKVFADGLNFELPPNMQLLGYVSDEEAKTLMRDSRAFLFPTFYEGFGLPPMEAMSVGARAIVSDASCMREIYRNSVSYVDPYDSNVDLEELLKTPVDDVSEVLDRYSWKRSAGKLYELIRTITN